MDGEQKMRLIDADATIKYLREFRGKDCDRRKGMKNGKIRFCYEIGDAPCRACDIGDTIDYFLDEDISTTVDAVQIVRCKDCRFGERHNVNVIKCMMRHEFCTPEPQYHVLSWFCADGEPKDGEQDAVD